MENWILVLVGLGTMALINVITKINSKLDEIIKRQNEIEESVLQEVRDYGIDRGVEDDPSGGSF